MVHRAGSHGAVELMTNQPKGPARRRLTPAQKRDIEYLHELKADEPFSGTLLMAADGTDYKIRILARGEQAFYQEGARALLLEISAAHGIILKSTIRMWDDAQAVTEDERARIIERIGRYLTARGDPATFTVR